MAHIEGSKSKTIEQLSEIVAGAIMEMNDGDEASIAKLVAEWYRGQGYEYKHIDIHHGYVWTKDGGATFALEDSDLFDILDQVTNMLKDKRKLDFSRYDDMFVGLPYNLDFTVRKVKNV